MANFVLGTLTLAGILAIAATSAQASNIKSAQGKSPAETASDVRTINFTCASGQKITVYRNLNMPEKITLHWYKKRYNLTKVPTTTGALRYENISNGIVWLEIPAKSMLLESNKGQQLADDCKDSEQK